MAYTVRFQDRETSEEVERAYDFEWAEGSDWWWSEGNFGCDCNRHLEFLRAKGIEPAPDNWPPCNRDRNRFLVLWIKAPDGKMLYQDDADR